MSTPTLLVQARQGRRRVLITQHGTTDVYLGASNVSTTNGLLLTGTKGTTVILESTADIYAVVAAGTQRVSCLEEY